ncbi:hypothetical protein CerSpe_214540 [Prunus speciosa]
MEDGNPFGGSKMVATRKGNCHGKHEGDGKHGELGGLNGVMEIAISVIPFQRGSAWEQPPPDLASYLYKNRIVYLGMSFVPSVTELILAEFLYLQYEDETKPIYLYVNSTGTTKGGEKLGYETEAFAIYDVMRSSISILLYVKPPTSLLWKNVCMNFMAIISELFDKFTGNKGC